MESGKRRPFYKNPWLIFVLGGIAFITISGPLMRNIPDPPEPIASLQEWSLETPDGRSWGSADLAGRTYVLAFISTRCRGGEACNAMRTAIEAVAKQFYSVDTPVWVVVVSTEYQEAKPAFRRWARTHMELWRGVTFLRGDKGSVEALMHSIGAHYEERAVQPWDLGLILVDYKGQLRGFYQTSKDGADEAAHRAVHVMREERK